MKYFSLALLGAAATVHAQTTEAPTTQTLEKLQEADGVVSAPHPGLRTVTGTLHAQQGLYLRSYIPTLLAEFLDDNTSQVDMILSHGCFCAKMDVTNPYMEFLGGTTPVDTLDEICRDWLRARNCNDNLVGGSCEKDRESMRTGTYTMDIRDPISNTACGFTTTNCETDTCLIDLDHVLAINDFMTNNPSHVAVGVTDSTGTCDIAPLEKKERKCLGTAPDVYPKRMGNIEMLFTRMDWVDDKNDDDVVYFNQGGLKINDKREHISIAVHNQLITYKWPNVKSFTVTNREDANSFYVGWVENSKVNNFQVGDTLGDDTKGGVKTSGIYSGTSTIRTMNGFELQASDPSNNFFNYGETVTCTHEGDQIHYYVNGVLVNSIDVSGWEGVFPAIDTEEQLELRITEVIFEDE